MTKQQTKEAIDVMHAYIMGKTIECRCEKKEWTRLTLCDPSWNWQESEYRIAPEPMEIEVWCKNGLPWALSSPDDESMFRDRFTKKTFREVL